MGISELGNKYGRLTVVKRAETFKQGNKTLACWFCICDCGIDCVVKGADLRSGHKMSCGCLKRERAIENCKSYAQSKVGTIAENTTNEIGNRYSLLTVISALPTKHRKARWLCKCDCGKNKRVSGDALRNGKVQSCGCLRKNFIKQTDLPIPNYKNASIRYRTYQDNARRKNLEFQIDLQEFEAITSLPCTYCGDKFERMGIDRVDNKLGYISGNTAPCCVHCNRMKLTYSVEDFLNRCEKIVNHKNATIGT